MKKELKFYLSFCLLWILIVHFSPWVYLTTFFIFTPFFIGLIYQYLIKESFSYKYIALNYMLVFVNDFFSRLVGGGDYDEIAKDLDFISLSMTLLTITIIQIIIIIIRKLPLITIFKYKKDIYKKIEYIVIIIFIAIFIFVICFILHEKLRVIHPLKNLLGLF